MQEWTKVVTHPLGLAGFALFLVFSLLARAKRRDERRWIFPVSLVMAVFALVGGLSLAYRQGKNTPATVIQINTDRGVNINNANGGTYNIDQSTGKSGAQQNSGTRDAADSNAQKASEPEHKSSEHKPKTSDR